MDKISIYANPKSDPYKDFMSMMIVDDRQDVLALLGRYASLEYENLLVACCSHPDPCVKIMEECFCDIGVFDMDLPGMTGDKLVEKAKAISKQTVTIIITAYQEEFGYQAGKSDPDIFISKAKGSDAVFQAISEGVRTAQERKRIYLDRFQGYFRKGLHAKKVLEFKEHFGFTPKQYMVSRKKMKSVALRRIKPHVSEVQIAEWAGFETSTNMKNALEKIEPLIA